MARLEDITVGSSEKGIVPVIESKSHEQENKGCIYFVRHGETVWNVENKICGVTDVPLTELGHQQAIETGYKILKEGIKADLILYSPLMRAAETAAHISEITGIYAQIESHFCYNTCMKILIMTT